jgi:primary-amine oxidase
MRGVLSIALGFTALVQPAKAQKAQCSAEQPLATAPHSNPWKALSEEDSESVTALLQQRLNLTGDGGSR